MGLYVDHSQSMKGQQMTETLVSPTPPKVRKLSRPAGMTVANIIEALGDTVSFEYRGDPEHRFRGVATLTRRREVRRRFWVVRDNAWTREGDDPYQDSDTTPEEDLQAALELGAEGVICSPRYKNSPLLEGRNVFFTPNTIDFTCRLIEAQRHLVRGRRTIAVTGSAGKTTTSAMIAHALRALDADAAIQHNNQNRNFLHWALAYLTRRHRYAHTVLEVSGGALSYAWDQYAISADISIVTSIAEAHLEIHDTLEGVARDKSNIFKNLPRDGAALINIDAPYSDVLVARAESEGARIITYGENPDADIQLTGYDLATGRVRANVVGLGVEYTLAARGRHIALNSLAVLASLRDLGLDWAAGMVALESFVQPTGRGREAEVPLPGGERFMLIDDSFNANPASVRASLKNLAETPSEGRKVAVLGDILELGEHSTQVHQSLAADIRAANLDSVHLLGEHLHEMYATNNDLAPEVRVWASIEDLIDELPQSLQPDDLVLIKGSGGTKLKKLAALFREQATED
jgi:UDP-N-acetylmuramoyl-tripeptide--D-alanyl-D-alanine ligase